MSDKQIIQMDKPLIYQLLPRAASEIGPIAKASRNQAQGYNFRGIDDVMDAVHPILTRHGITPCPRVTHVDRSERSTSKGGSMSVTFLTVDYDFVAPDGSKITATVVGEGMDSGDKSANKAMSAAFKYAIGQVLTIPFDTMDSERDDPRIQRQAPPAKPAIAKPSEEKPISKDVQMWLDWLAKKPDYEGVNKSLADANELEKDDRREVKRRIVAYCESRGWSWVPDETGSGGYFPKEARTA